MPSLHHLIEDRLSTGYTDKGTGWGYDAPTLYCRHMKLISNEDITPTPRKLPMTLECMLSDCRSSTQSLGLQKALTIERNIEAE